MLPKQTLILGGARSGKSAFAERLTTAFNAPRTYIATAQAHDDEMRARIAAHLDQRGTQWRTIEAPLNTADALRALPADTVALLDCATLWLSNHLLADSDLDAETDALLKAITCAPCPVITVSNEVGQGIVPENALARRFRDAQGRLNQRLAAQSDLAVLIAVGLPLVLKGSLPAPLS